MDDSVLIYYDWRFDEDCVEVGETIRHLARRAVGLLNTELTYTQFIFHRFALLTATYVWQWACGENMDLLLCKNLASTTYLYFYRTLPYRISTTTTTRTCRTRTCTIWFVRTIFSGVNLSIYGPAATGLSPLLSFDIMLKIKRVLVR